MNRYGESSRLLRLSDLLRHMARLDTDTREHLRLEIAVADSYPTQTPGAAAPTAARSMAVCHCQPWDTDGCDVCTPVTLTRPERATVTRIDLQNELAQMNDDLRALEEIAASLGKTYRRALGLRRSAPAPRLCDCSGHEGAELARSDGGWSDPTCQNLADKAGLCAACYMRKRRHLIRIGKPAREDAA